MPTYERRFFIETLRGEHEKTQQAIEEKNNTTSTGKGKRSTTMSGGALKNKMKSGEIPN